MVLTLFLFQGTGKTFAQDTTLNLNVMSFNVRYGTASDGKNSWKSRRGLVTELIDEVSPDVIGTQEALRFQLDEIREDLSHYGEIGAGRDDGRKSGEYAAILYKTRRFKIWESGTFWLSDHPHHPGSSSWGNRLPRICTWALLIEKGGNGGFYIFNTHLDHWSQNSRRKSIDLIMDNILKRRYPYPVIITGDFNVGERNPIIRFIKGQTSGKDNSLCPFPMIDTFRAIHPKAIGGTFNLFLGYRYGPKIDFIFADSTASVSSARIIRNTYEGKYPSDHFPVSADVQFSIR